MSADRAPIVLDVAALPHLEGRRTSTGEALGRVADLSERLGLRHLRVHHEVLLPGRRSSPAHHHSAREELVFVLAGAPSLDLAGEVRRLAPGCVVGLCAATGQPHHVFNDTDEPAELLVASATPGEDVVTFGP